MPSWTQLLQMLWTSLRRRQRVICGFTSSSARADIEQIKLFVESGVLKPVVDRTYALDENVAAHRYADSGRKRGSVVIKIFDGPVAARRRP